MPLENNNTAKEKFGHIKELTVMPVIDHADKICICNHKNATSPPPPVNRRDLPFELSDNSRMYPVTECPPARTASGEIPNAVENIAKNAGRPMVLDVRTENRRDPIPSIIRDPTVRSRQSDIPNQSTYSKYSYYSQNSNRDMPTNIRAVQSKESMISSNSSESTLSVVILQNEALPLLPPRKHGPHCAVEISVLEKHKEGCANKKGKREGRHPIDDRAGSYDVINRIIYPTCSPTGRGDAIKNSPKSFSINDPSTFGKDLKEVRSRVDTIPILPDYSNIVMLAETSPASSKRDNMDVLSVYIRMDKNEMVPPGFQKMHYRGDSCKLHDPNERERQIIALQKVLQATSSGAHLDKSQKKFSSGQQPLYMATLTNLPQLPTVTTTTKLPAVNSPLKICASLNDRKYSKTLSMLNEPVDIEQSEESFSQIRKGSSLYVDSLDAIPLSLRQNQTNKTYDMVEPPDKNSGIFAYFKRKTKKPKTFVEEENDFFFKRAAHTDNESRRHSNPIPKGHKLSAQYGARKR